MDNLGFYSPEVLTKVLVQRQLRASGSCGPSKTKNYSGYMWVKFRFPWSTLVAFNEVESLKNINIEYDGPQL